MSDYTPTTEQVRATYLGGTLIEFREEGFGRFQRWLAARDREVAAKAFRDAAEHCRTHTVLWSGGRGVIAWLENRADRIEKGELT